VPHQVVPAHAELLACPPRAPTSGHRECWWRMDA